MSALALRRRAVGALVVMTAALSAAAPAVAAVGDLDLVSRADGQSGAASGGFSDFPSISADGTRVAFRSSADGLAPDDANGQTDILMRDMRRGTTTLVSRADGATGTPADGGSIEPSMSADGRYVAFTSRAANLTADAVSGIRHVFVRDLQEGTTILADRASGPAGAVASYASYEPSISGDGRFVAFTSVGTNLTDDPGTPAIPARVYVRDLQSGTTTLVSRAGGPNGVVAAGGSPSISRDGRHVAFVSTAPSLAGEDHPFFADVFLRDLQTGTTTLVSRPSTPGEAAAGPSVSPSVSGDGRFVAFTSNAPDLAEGDDESPGPTGVGTREIYVRDRAAGTTTLASGPLLAEGLQSADLPSISHDGLRVAFQAFPSTGSSSNVFVGDLTAGTATLTSHAPGAPTERTEGHDPALSGDGRFVTFTSRSNAISDEDSDATDDVFRRDLLGPPPGTVEDPVCAPAPEHAPPATEPADEARFTLSRAQLLINQRIAQAAVRRLNAVQARLDAGLAAHDLCGHAIGTEDLHPAIATTVAAASLAPAAPATPAPVRPAPAGDGDPAAVRLTAAQLLINQRIGQAAVRRANGLAARLEAGLTGGEVLDGQVSQGKLADRLQVTSAPATPAPAPSRTVIPPRAGPTDPSSVRLTVAQLRINQRVYQAAVRRANALVARLEAGVTGAEIRDGSLTAADLATGVAPVGSS